MTTSDARPRRRSLFVPLLLVGFGVVALGQRFGWFDLNPGEIIANFWPLLLIGLGIDLIFGRHRVWVGVILAVLVFGGMAATVAVLGSNLATVSSAPQPFSDPLANVRSARVVFDGSASTISLRALPAEDAQLLSGSFTSSRAALRHEFSLDDGVAQVRLDSKQQGWFVFGSDRRAWDVALSPAVPLDLDLDFSAVSVDVDLRNLQITTIKLDISAGDGTITLPDSGKPTITLDASAATLVLVLPAGVEARITADTSASSLDVDGRFSKQGNVYTTAGWATAEERLDITLDASAASVEIK